jgi:hypothetical protein
MLFNCENCENCFGQTMSCDADQLWRVVFLYYVKTNTKTRYANYQVFLLFHFSCQYVISLRLIYIGFAYILRYSCEFLASWFLRSESNLCCSDLLGYYCNLIRLLKLCNLKLKCMRHF